MKKHIQNVLLVNFEMTYTGSPQALFNLTTALQNLGYKTDVWTLTPGPFEREFENIGIIVETLNFPDAIEKKLENRLRTYTHIFANTIFCAEFAEYASRFSNTILFIHEAGNLRSLIHECSINVHCFLKAKYVLCVSEYAKQCILNQYPVLNIEILPNYINKQKNFSCKKTNEIVRFLVSGTYEFRKGQDVAVDAFLALTNELQQLAELHFIGRAPEWSVEYQNKLKLKKNERIFFHKEINNKQELFEFYSSMDVIIISSRDESCSLVALEAAMLKKCLLVTENTGAKYIVANRKCILPTNEVFALSEAMERYIRHPNSCSKEGKKNYRCYIHLGTYFFYKKRLKKIIKKIKLMNKINNRKI